ncbi:hypothetical protein J4208_02850 [Candidatus Woesearchaeota archaeon]|nr:hypothetical protein [Candidatus Woesearchaeota archaeon]
MTQPHDRTFKTILIILGVILVLLFLAIYFWQPSQNSDYFFKYNGFQFQQDQNGYKLTLYINNQNVPAIVHLREDPRTLENIPVEGNVQVLRTKQQIYVTLDPYANLTGKTTIGALEIDAILDNPYLFSIPVSSAFTVPFANATVKTCADVNATEGVILLQTGEETLIRETQGCITVQGVTEEDIIRASDRLIYTLLKIMDP